MERLGLERANRLGVSAPRLLAAGVIEDRYRFPYLIMERLSGVSLGALLESDCLSPQEQRRIGRQLREITDRMNTPLSRLFLSRRAGPRPGQSPLGGLFARL